MHMYPARYPKGPAPIIGIGKEKDPSASYMQAHTIGNYALACCNVLRDDEASLRMPHLFIATLAKEEEKSNQSRRFWQSSYPPSVASAPAAYRRMPKHPEAFSRLPIQQPQVYRSVYCYLPPKILSRIDTDNGRRAKVELAVFADDTALYTLDAQPKALTRLQTAIDILDDWFRKWRVEVNPEKRAAMYFSKVRSQTPRPLKLFDRPDSWVTKVKYLEVTLDPKLNFNKHIKHVRDKAAFYLGRLYSMINAQSKLVNIENKVMLFKTCIRPVLTYAGVVFANMLSYKILVIQNRFVRTAIDTLCSRPRKSLHVDPPDIHHSCESDRYRVYLRHPNNEGCRRGRGYRLLRAKSGPAYAKISCRLAHVSRGFQLNLDRSPKHANRRSGGDCHLPYQRRALDCSSRRGCRRVLPPALTTDLYMDYLIHMAIESIVGMLTALKLAVFELQTLVLILYQLVAVVHLRSGDPVSPPIGPWGQCPLREDRSGKSISSCLKAACSHETSYPHPQARKWCLPRNTSKGKHKSLVLMTHEGSVSLETMLCSEIRLMPARAAKPRRRRPDDDVNQSPDFVNADVDLSILYDRLRSFTSISTFRKIPVPACRAFDILGSRMTVMVSEERFWSRFLHFEKTENASGEASFVSLMDTLTMDLGRVHSNFSAFF
ncbi:RNA-directed DNA polymerase from mobile element jockey [Eumeta japonica]|uniref:RNA-directed DNA polymerase from mobile element jockey n=1 Tax=Eumeta variegata TaxID=151549 RepID=A0A4C1ZC29_EUMVA|nr:RNA-directed DNA polymerase from mobile element jockey [Eumeta japonica]